MSAVTDKARKGAPFFVTTLAGSMSDSDTTFTLQSATGIPTDTAVDFVIDRLDQNGDELDPSLREVITGTISGTTVTTDSSRRGRDDTTAQAHNAGAVVEINFTSATWNDLVTAYLVSHNQDGTQKALTEADIVDTTQIVDEAVEGSKIATYRLPYQTDNSNSIANTTGTTIKLQAGWGQRVGNGNQAMSESVTFPATFSTVLGVSVVFVGLTGADSTPATSIADFDSNLTTFTAITHSQNITTSGFTAQMTAEGGSTFSNTRYYGYSWIAWGT